MTALSKMVLVGISLVFAAAAAQAQCATWVGSPNEASLKEAHVLYRGIVKGKAYTDLAKLDDSNFNLAFDNWKKAYEGAPAADGQRAAHFVDGIELYKAEKERAKDEVGKAHAEQLIIKLYDQYVVCYPKDAPYAYGRKAVDMFYMTSFGYRTETFKAFQEALDKGGNNVEYIVFEPLGMLVAYLFKSQQISREEARNAVIKAKEIAEHNTVNNEKYGQYYEASAVRMEFQLREVEKDIFDCEYFKEKLIPTYRENPDDLDVLRYVYNTLKTQGCAETDSIMLELKTKYEETALELNTRLTEEFLAKNPGVAARKLYENGKYSEALDKYKEAIAQEEDTDKQAEYYFSMASIQFRQLKAYSAARDNARKAASLRSGWGRPYMLIGDMYAASSRNCGSDGYSRGLAVLAAIDKYAYARSIDSEVAGEASRKISLYSASVPPKDDVFMRGVNNTRVTVPCWIGETVTLKY
ncbi:MAG: hypothetical protein KIPDCIKN_01096 [Haliscomenobacter sp.]|nr:hypothetical protein [Haliscomenobacter sp.]